jgi:hypothetical protein
VRKRAGLDTEFGNGCATILTMDLIRFIAGG